MCSCRVFTLVSGRFVRRVSASCTRYIPIVPLATHRLLPSRVSLLSNATMRRLRRPDAPSLYSCRELEHRYPDSFRCFALTAPGKTGCKPGRCSLGFIPFRDSSGRFRPSQVPWIPTCTSAKLSDPGRITLPIAFADSTMRSPPYTNRKTPAINKFSRFNSHGFSTYSIRFVPPLRNDYAMFASGWWPTFAEWEWLPTGYQLYLSSYLRSISPDTLGLSCRDVFFVPW